MGYGDADSLIVFKTEVGKPTSASTCNLQG